MSSIFYRDSGRKANPVVMVQGFGAPTLRNFPVKIRLELDGIPTYNAEIPGLNTHAIEVSSDIVARTVADVKNKTGADKVNLVGVSMGGLIALYYIRRLGGHKMVDKFISLATPFHGTDLAAIPHLVSGAVGAGQMLKNSGFLKSLHQEPFEDCEVYSMYVEGDPFVTKEAASLKNAKLVYSPHGRWPVGHYYPLFHPQNYRIIKSILLNEYSGPLHHLV